MTEDAQVLVDIKYMDMHQEMAFTTNNIDELKKAIEATVVCKDGAPGYKPFYGEMFGEEGHRELIGPPYIVFGVIFPLEDEAQACRMLWKDFLKYRLQFNKEATLFWRRHLEISNNDQVIDSLIKKEGESFKILGNKKITMRFVIVNNSDIPIENEKSA